MKIIFFVLLMLKIGRCTDGLIFETRTVVVGQNVTLTCTRQTTWLTTNLFWIRVISERFPEILGGTLSHDYQVAEEPRRVQAKQEPGAFVLRITKTEFSDTAIYYCIKVKKSNMTFLKGIFLRIKGPEPDITAIIQDFPSDPVHPGDSVTLQCSVLSDSENKCLEEHRVFWFRAGSHESHPSLIYAQRNNSGECEKSLETHSPQKCIYSFSKNVSPSDAGTYYCAVATCGEILFGNGTKLDIEVGSTCDSQNDNTTVFLLCAALAISLIVIAVLVYAIMKNSCNAAATLQTNAATAVGNQQSQQRYEDTLVYYTPVFTRRKAGNAGRRSRRKEEMIYTDVRAFVRAQQSKY